jgi:Zn finger protein HypA/HybF involved in hydrogenase expression
MKFDIKFKDISEGYIINTSEGNIERVKTEGECGICKDKTQWFNSIFDKYLCSEECTDHEWYKFWRRY